LQPGGLEATLKVSQNTQQKKFPGFECNASVFWLIVLKRIGFS
jgi:hypothetical protein